MSRTYRQKEGIKFKEGRPTREVPYICRCEWCTNRERQKIKEKIVDKEIKKGVDYMYGDTILDEWEAVEEYWNKNPLTLEEEENWKEYRNVA